MARPVKYETPEEMQRVIDLYFLACKVRMQDNQDLLIGLSEEDILIINDVESTSPGVAGLAYTLGMTRQSLCNYENKDGFFDTIKRAKLRVEISLENKLAGQAVTGSIFNLKNNFGWKDKTETEHTGQVIIQTTDKDEAI